MIQTANALNLFLMHRRCLRNNEYTSKYNLTYLKVVVMEDFILKIRYFCDYLSENLLKLEGKPENLAKCTLFTKVAKRRKTQFSSAHFSQK